MDIRRYCQVMGAIFLALGVLGFIPGLAPHHGVAGDPSTTGLLFGLFPINGLHNLVHVAFGIWAIAASRLVETARTFCTFNAVIYGVLTIFGFIPGLNNLFGLMPLHGHDVWLHGLIALSSAYFAWGWTERRTVGTAGRL